MISSGFELYSLFLKNLTNLVLVLCSKSEAVLILVMPLPQDDPLQRQPIIDLAKKELNGWEPKVHLEEGLKKTIGYFDDLLRGKN